MTHTLFKNISCRNRGDITDGLKVYNWVTKNYVDDYWEELN